MSEGTIVSINGTTLTVRTNCQAACSACSARQNCVIKSLPGRLVTVDVNNPADYNIGQKVDLELPTEAVKLSLFFAYGMPLFLVVGTAAGAIFFGCGDTLASIMALGILVPYFLGLRLADSWLKKRVKIRIK